MNEDKATRYRRLRRRAGVLRAAVWVALLVGVLISGLSQTLAQVSVTMASRIGVPGVLAPSASVAIYASALVLVGLGAVFPLTWHTELVLGRRFGLSRQRTTDWLRHQAPTIAAHVLVWTVGSVLVYAAIQQWPTRWWLLAGPVFGAVTLAMTHVAPVITLPWLYRLRPLRRSDLKTRLHALVQRVGAPVTAIHEWQTGEETPRPNAALVGIGPTLQVLVTDALLDGYSDDEIEVVVAHELAHHVHGDMWKTLGLETATAMVACGVAHWALSRVGPWIGVAGATDASGLPVVILAAGAVVMMMMPLANWMSRRHESRADRFALVVTGNPEALASGLQRLAEQALAEERPSRLVEWLFYTHPPLAARIGMARAAMAAPPRAVEQGS